MLLLCTTETSSQTHFVVTVFRERFMQLLHYKIFKTVLTCEFLLVFVLEIVEFGEGYEQIFILSLSTSV
jgi:hypothetical protein